jgi:heme O synthase-like polyprenyltransferase
MTGNAPSHPLVDAIGRQSEDGDLSDMLSELRILLPGAQMLTAFLIILPFNGGARAIIQAERLMFLATFFFALSSLVLLSAPAIQHRLMRPLARREQFKRVATRQIVTGSASMACAFTLGTNLVLSSVFGQLVGLLAGLTMAAAVLFLWCLLPLYLKRRHGY